MRVAPLRTTLAGALALTLLGWSGLAVAQNDPFGRGFGSNDIGGGGTAPSSKGTTPPPQKQQQEAAPGQPELHAASGGESLIPQGAEPSIPQEPLEVKDSVKEIIGSDHAGQEVARGLGTESSRDFWGLWYDEINGSYRFRTLFPFWVERQQPSLIDPTKIDRASVYGGLYYNRRSATQADDVLFPVFWNLRDTESRTTIVGPVVNRVAPDETDNWLAPLYFVGDRKPGGYTVIPPLLTWTQSDAEGGLNIVALAFCSWKGGRSCDSRSAKSMDAGLAPLWFYGHDKQTNYRLIPPLLSYSHTNERTETELDIYGGLYYRKHTPELESLHVFPLYYSLWGEKERHTTVLPFFHYGYAGKQESLLVTPLFLQKQAEDGATTHVNWLYARHRGRTELDMYTPLYWQYRDPDAGLSQHLFAPVYFSRTSPRESTYVVFPLFSDSIRYGVSRSTWITPLFRYAHDLTGWDIMLNPLFYAGRDGRESHTVVAPLYWDFKGVDRRTTIAFPFYWDFQRPTLTTSLYGNVYIAQQNSKASKSWEAHVFPLMSFGGSRDGHWWKLLYGLVGYEQRGAYTEVQALWIPFGNLPE